VFAHLHLRIARDLARIGQDRQEAQLLSACGKGGDGAMGRGQERDGGHHTPPIRNTPAQRRFDEPGTRHRVLAVEAEAARIDLLTIVVPDKSPKRTSFQLAEHRNLSRSVRMPCAGIIYLESSVYKCQIGRECTNRF
jgi:hypothetical protein